MMHIHGPMEKEALQSMSVLELAHVGDGVYELLARTHLAREGGQKVRQLHRRTIAYVSAVAQARAMERLLPELTEEERAFCRRGRNARVRPPSGCTAAEYHAATALETVFGYLWLTGQARRAEELFALILEEHDAS